MNFQTTKYFSGDIQYFVRLTNLKRQINIGLYIFNKTNYNDVRYTIKTEFENKIYNISENKIELRSMKIKKHY